jgi:hypothetical protein
MEIMLNSEIVKLSSASLAENSNPNCFAKFTRASSSGEDEL